MPIDFRCAACGQGMRVDEQHAGRQAKCPHCGTSMTVPSPQPLSAPAGQAVNRLWHLQTGDNRRFGPVAREVLDQWQVEGLVDRQSQVFQEGWEQWKWATDVYPALAQSPASSEPATGLSPAIPTVGPASRAGLENSPPGTQSSGIPVLPGVPSGQANPGTAPAQGPYAQQTADAKKPLPVGQATSLRTAVYVKPHRGSLILVLGILSIVFCQICGIPAWVMGSADLREMQFGRMDRGGEEQTRAGMICGIVGTVLIILQIVFAILWLLFVFGLIFVGVASQPR